MQRYNIIENKNPREIVLLKSKPCPWGKCTFCDYIQDNSTDSKEIININHTILSKVTGKYNQLEIINSATVTTIPKETLIEIKQIAKEKNIHTLYFEALYKERDKLEKIRKFFPDTNIKFKCGIETFNEEFRNKILNKGFKINSYEEAAKEFSNICLLFGIKGQTKEMIDTDIQTGLKYFQRLCINIYTPNTTKIKQDKEIIRYFKEKYEYLQDYENVEILYENTDFGVGD